MKQIFMALGEELTHSLNVRFDVGKSSQVLSTRVLYKKVSAKVEYSSIYYSYYRDDAWESLDSCKLDLSKISPEKDASFVTEFLDQNEEISTEITKEFLLSDQKEGVEEKGEISSKTKATDPSDENCGQLKPKRNPPKPKDNSMIQFFVVCLAILVLIFFLFFFINM